MPLLRTSEKTADGFVVCLFWLDQCLSTFFEIVLTFNSPVFTTQYTKIASMLMEKNKTPVKENISLYQ